MSPVRVAVAITCCGVLAACKAIPLNEDPTVPRREARVTHPAVFEVAWNTPLVKTGLLEWQPIEAATPAVDPDTERVIVTTRDGYVRALSPIDGRIEWEFKTRGRFFGGAAVYEGIAYVAGGDGFLYALRARTGEVVWEYKANEELVTVPTVAEGKVLVASQSETVFAVELQTGKWLWQYRRDAPSGFTIRGTAQPVVSNGRVLMGFADGSIVSLGLDDGVARWERKLTTTGGTQFLDVDSTPVVEDDHVYAASYKDGVYSLDAKTGDVEWSSAKAGVTSLVKRGAVLFTAGDGTISAIETARGKTLWTLDLSDKSSKGKGNNAGRALTIARGFIVVPTATALAFVDPSTGKVRSMWNPGRGVTATPTRFNSVRWGSRLYVLSNLGTVFALQMVSAGG